MKPSGMPAGKYLCTYSLVQRYLLDLYGFYVMAPDRGNGLRYIRYIWYIRYWISGMSLET